MLIYPTLKMAPIQGLIGFGGGATGFLSPGVAPGLFDFTTHTFTTGSTSGKNGPVHSTLVSAYSGTSWASDTDYFVQGEFQGYQKWTVPSTGIYEFEMEGASGGKQSYAEANVSGSTFNTFGAKVICRLSLVEGAKIQLVVGQKGMPSTYANDSSEGDNPGPGGGGASWVFSNTSDSQPLIVAGAGAGGTRNVYTDAYAAFDSTSGHNGQLNSQSAANGLGGQNGNGGRTNAGETASYWSGGGAGWVTDGTGGNQSTNYNRTPGDQGGQGGAHPGSGLLGGTRWNDGTDSGGDGGFGGGGGGGSDNTGTGGGAGYSGGAGGNSNPQNGAGGGGGTYITSSATNITQSQSTLTNVDGYIKITKV